MPVFDEVQAIASALLTELCCRVNESDHPVCRCGFAFGDTPPVSNCCDCATGQGEAFVRVGSIFPAATFPAQDSGATRCDFAAMAVTFTLGIYRCAPTLDDRGNAPTMEQMAAALAVQLQDRAILAQVVRCLFRDEDRSWLMGAWNPIEPLGGCVGGALTVTVAFDDCLDCPECPGGE